MLRKASTRYFQKVIKNQDQDLSSQLITEPFLLEELRDNAASVGQRHGHGTLHISL